MIETDYHLGLIYELNLALNFEMYSVNLVDCCLESIEIFPEMIVLTLAAILDPLQHPAASYCVIYMLQYCPCNQNVRICHVNDEQVHLKLFVSAGEMASPKWNYYSF